MRSHLLEAIIRSGRPLNPAPPPLISPCHSTDILPVDHMTGPRPRSSPSLESASRCCLKKQQLLEPLLRSSDPLGLSDSLVGLPSRWSRAQAIVYVDYPERWPDLLPAVMQNLTSPEQHRIHGALYCLRIIARKYEFKDEVRPGPHCYPIQLTYISPPAHPRGKSFDDVCLAVPAEQMERVPLAEVIRTTFPTLLQLLQVCALRHCPRGLKN